MNTFYTPENEIFRLNVLSRYAILDTVAEESFDRITHLASKLLKMPIALVSLVEQNRQWFKSCVGLNGKETSREVSFCAHAIYREDLLVIQDATEDSRFRENPYVVSDPFVRFYAGVPLIVSEGVALGTLCVLDVRPRQLKRSQIEILRNLAAIVCDELAYNKLAREAEEARLQLSVHQEKLALLNASLEEKVELRTLALQESNRDILSRLGRAAAYRDNDTNQHVQRMSLFCELIARSYGMAEPYCQLMRTASAFHDIGKIGIPDSILHKPGELTSEEMEIMKEHTEIGRQLLSGGQTDLVQLAELISFTHHERWDGTGYPQGLCEESIPLPGRIAAVADVFDALTSERAYKKAWTVDQAAVEIRSNAGKQFDPEVVNALMRVLPELKQVCNQFSRKPSIAA